MGGGSQVLDGGLRGLEGSSGFRCSGWKIWGLGFITISCVGGREGGGGGGADFGF